MNVEQLINAVKSEPNTIDFEDTMAVIEQFYEFTPTAFRNGETENGVGENNGSCKILAFGLVNKLSVSDTLKLFGRFYFEDVLKHPEANDHQNIRNFMQQGWEGVEFSREALTLR